jgi:hypothetical protein
MGGSACSPVLEGEEHEVEGDGFKLAPALPLTANGIAGVQNGEGEPQDERRISTRVQTK